MFSCVNLSGIRTRSATIDLDIPNLPEAACKGHPNLKDFHPANRATNVDKARAICAACPVKTECLDYCTEWERRHGVTSGVWGGLTEWERHDARGRGRPDTTEFCGSGRHELTEDNLYNNGNTRTCKACRRESWAAYGVRRRANARDAA